MVLKNGYLQIFACCIGMDHALYEFYPDMKKVKSCNIQRISWLEDIFRTKKRRLQQEGNR